MNNRLVFALRHQPGYVDGVSPGRDLTALPTDTVALNLERSGISDAGLAALPRLKALRCLDLDGTNVTDEALAAISTLPVLEELWLECTHVTDVGIERLAACSSLRFVSVAYTSVTPAGIARLEPALPGIVVST